MNLKELLSAMVSLNASDLHIHLNMPPSVRIRGDLHPMEGYPPISDENIQSFLNEFFRPGMAERFAANEEIDTSFGVAGVGRFRINIYRQRGTIAIAIRRVGLNIPNFEELCLPPAVEYLTQFTRGLVLVTGMTGTGKSTTLASMIGHINATRRCHIVTLEDPIEYLHHNKSSIVSQREIGQDTINFSSALRSVLRQDPDVILIGELRDADTIKVALSAAETGHLVLSTLHTTNAAQTIERILEYFNPDMRPIIRQQLATHLRGVVSQLLLPRLDTATMIPAVEVMLMNPLINKKILEAKYGVIKSIMHHSTNEGMQTFDQHLVALYNAGLVSFDAARAQSSNPDSFHLFCRGFFPDIIQDMEG